MMTPYYLQASANPGVQILDFAAFTLVLGILGIFVAYLFAEVLTSLILVAHRWSILLQSILLALAGSAIGFLLFYVLSGQMGLWFEGGITGLMQLIISRNTDQRSRLHATAIALIAGIIVFLTSLQVIDDERLVEYGAAISTGLFTAVYTYMARQPESTTKVRAETNN
jgi:hypothetical protein